MTALARMIAAQPDALRRVARTDVTDAVATLSQAPRLVLAGTGTSHHAALLGAALIAAHGRPARAIESVRLARFDAVAADEAVIVITHTGQTAYAQDVRRQVLAHRRPLVSITGPQVDWPEALHTPVAEDSETYTVSYTAVLAVLALLAHGLTDSETGPAALARVADHVAYVVADPGVDAIPVPARALAIAGAGPWAVTAAEGALKLREGARMLADGYDAERLLHGHAVPYGPADGLLLVQPDADPDGLTAAVGAAARGAGIPVSELSDPNPERDPVLAQIAMTVRLQCLAARMAALRGTDADVVITGAWDDPALWSLGAPPD